MCNLLPNYAFDQSRTCSHLWPSWKSLLWLTQLTAYPQSRPGCSVARHWCVTPFFASKKSNTEPPRSTVKLLKRIPRTSRDHAAKKLATILDQVVLNNNTAYWDGLFSSAPRYLRVPRRGGHCRSLASHVNAMLREQSDPDPPDSIPEERSHRQHRGQDPQDPPAEFGGLSGSKAREGDIKGAIRLASSEDTIATPNPGTLSALQEKHPPQKCSPGSRGDPSPVVSIAPPIQVSSEKVVKAICSFPCGSAGGPGGLRPQQLKDMITDLC